jgi:hypothetical protein
LAAAPAPLAVVLRRFDGDRAGFPAVFAAGRGSARRDGGIPGVTGPDNPEFSFYGTYKRAITEDCQAQGAPVELVGQQNSGR